MSMSPGDARAFGARTVVATHDLHKFELFSNASLAELLDNFPRRNLYALATGSDPTRPDQNRLALHDGLSGADLLQAVHRGCLWLNITRVTDADPCYRALVNSLYEQIAANVAGFAVRSSQATLVVSSPSAVAYYHADGPASVLWHIRGRKRVWVYPANDPRYADREALEDIVVGARHEYLASTAALDRGASTHDLQPGQWISWPQNSPHRVSNLEGINVSLSTEHVTDETRRRARVHAAKRFLRVRLGLRNPSIPECGPLAVLKMLTHGLANKAGLNRITTKRHSATMRVDAAAPGGASPIVNGIRDTIDAASSATSVTGRVTPG
jgi:hypothetical protein